MGSSAQKNFSFYYYLTCRFETWHIDFKSIKFFFFLFVVGMFYDAYRKRDNSILYAQSGFWNSE